MIASLFGEVSDKSLDKVVIEVGGVGYQLYISSQEFEELKPGEKYKLFVHESIREDAYDLYGFVSEQSKKLFELLISVKNIGPKAGLSVLSIGSPDRVKSAIASADLQFLMSAKGVGKKAAEQVIVELRDKVGLTASAEADEVVTRGAIDLTDEALQALVSLGYSEQDAATFLKSIDPKLPTDERLKLALKGAK
ncbi:MAG TPA: Holliday junction branch migration protein RuvA [Candidatus Saccharimonadales bacterium]|jgi:Holliday junction DNA helicase RuvA